MRRWPSVPSDRGACPDAIISQLERAGYLSAKTAKEATRSCGDAQHIIPYLLGWSEMMVQTPNIISGAAGPESGGGPPF